jgi:hypothetical protein
VFTESWRLRVLRFQDCSDGRNGICGERGQWEPLQVNTLGRFTVLHLALPMLCEKEDIEVYRPISPLALYHTHKMHLLCIMLYPSLFGGLADQGLSDALPRIYMPCNDTIIAIFVPGIVASLQQNFPLAEQQEIDGHEHP